MNFFSPMSDLNPNELWLSNRVTTTVCVFCGVIALALSPLASASENPENSTSYSDITEAATTLGQSAASTPRTTFDSYTR